MAVTSVQYARLLGGGATVVAFARSDEKLTVAKENGAHHTVNTRDKKAEDVQNELEDLTGRRDVDAVLDCAGAEESLALGFAILAAEGALASVGLIGQRVEMPLFPFVSGEKSYFGSFWGNYNDLTEVLALADEGLINHNINPVKLEDINDNLEALGRGDVVGRAVIVFDSAVTYIDVMSDDDLAVALALAGQADEVTRARFGAVDLRVDTKPDLTPVSDADHAVERALRETLARVRPETASWARNSAGQPPSPVDSGSSTRSTAPRTSSAGFRSGPA